MRLAQLMNPRTGGHRVAGGERLGKTITLAKNQRYAEFIQEPFHVRRPSQHAAHRDQRRRARQWDRHPRGTQPRPLQTRSLPPEILANDRTRLFESPDTDLAPSEPESFFNTHKVGQIVTNRRDVREHARPTKAC